MKIILTSLNSKFIHSNLAIRYLQAYTKYIANIDIQEYTINQSVDYIAREIYKSKPDIIGFSTYIWNLHETLKVCEILKIVLPDLKIILGGPEVSFDPKSILKESSFIDYIIYGEGEEAFKELLIHLINKDEAYNIDGLVYREDGDIIKNKERKLIKVLDTIPSPYTNMKDEFENKIVYYESSRGCPFSCEFCLSSTIQGVRFFSLDRVKEDLDRLIKGKVKQVKFVDRTFNANKLYAMEIMKFIIEKDPQNMNFHFEVTAHLLDEETLEFLKNVKEGLFQFEIGVQSTNDKTIEAIGRTTDFEKLRDISKRIGSYKNIHQHLDLIAGLPYEDYNSFRKSFNDVYEIKPEKLQLGFLKLLKGSGLRLESDKYGYKYIDEPPYEVIENKYIDFQDMIRLKGIEDLVERYYNGGCFYYSLEFIIKNFYDSPFDFYEDFFSYWDRMEYHRVSHSRNRLYKILREFFYSKDFHMKETLDEIIEFDYFMNNEKGNLPFEVKPKDKVLSQNQIHEILKKEDILEKYLAEYKDLPTKRLINKVRIQVFNRDIPSIINNDYKLSLERELRIILFKYVDGNIIRCESQDITKKVEELI